MKGVKSLVVTILLLLSGLTMLAPAGAAPEPQATTTRTVLIELFTGAACPPCVNVDKAADQMGEDYTRDQIAILVYHEDIPSDDKLTTTETYNRLGWYIPAGQNWYTPDFWVDGKIHQIGGFGSVQDGVNWFTSAYNTRKAIDSQLDITLDGLIYQGSKKGDVWVNVTALEAPSYSNLILHLVVYRNEYGPWNGGNGITEHRMVVRDMVPSQQGTSISPTPGSPYTGHFTFDLSGDEFTQYDDMGIVAFVQTGDKNTDGVGAPRTRYLGEVLQSKDASLRTIPNRLPVLYDADIDKDNVTEDEYVTFGVNYSDPDGVAPDEVKVIIQNGTETAFEHGLDPKSGDWVNGRRLEYSTKLKPGNYRFKFAARDAFADATGDPTGWSDYVLKVRPRNKVPELFEYNFGPFSGDTTTTFRFDIMYRDIDNEQPTSAQIFIDGTPHQMQTDSTGPWNDWVTYYYETTLSVGDDHRFYYLFSDGIDEVRDPPLSQSPNWYLGPEVEPPNEAPTLTTELFSPSTGTRSTDFTFSVIYTDGEDDYPSTSYIYIDGVAQLMMGTGTNFRNGVRFEYTTRLDLGPHTYYFKFNDGKDHVVRYPAAESAVFDGPTVTNLAPTAVIRSPDDGTRYTPTDYVPLSAVGSSDPEDDTITFKWESDIDGPLGDQEATDIRLSEAWHNITLTVTDSHGAEATAKVQIEVRAKRPHAFIKSLRVSDERPTEKDPVRITVTVANDGEAVAEGLDVNILVDGVEVYSSPERVVEGGERDVSYTWTAVVATHIIRAEITGDSEEYEILVDANKLPPINPAVYSTNGAEVNYYPKDEVFFRANVGTDPEGDTYTFEWDFGDGTAKSTQRDPSHIYMSPGTYNVTLKITDARGGVAEKSFEVAILKPKEDSPGFGGLFALAALGAVVATVAVARRRRK